MTIQARARVVFVGAFPPATSEVVGGQARACRTLMESSLIDRFDFTLVDSTQVSNPPPGLMKRFYLAVLRMVRFTKALIRIRPDAVLLFAPVGLGLFEKGVMARLAESLNVPSVLFPRGAEVIQTYRQSPIHRYWIRWVFRSSSVNCCQGPVWRHFLVDDLGIPVSRARIVENWTATPELTSVGSLRSSSAPSNRPKLLFLGWLEQEKGVIELLQACALLSEKNEFDLIFAGSGRAESAVRTFVADRNLHEVVTLIGWVSREALPRLLGEVDVLVLPSWAEGFPNAVVEAMAAGVAVVTTSVGAIPDFLTDGDNALVVPPRNLARLTSALDQVINDVSLRTHLQVSGHRFACENFTPEQAADKISTVINDVIGAHNC